VAALSDDQIQKGLADLPGWSRTGAEIERTYELPSFPDAVAFVTRVGFLAEAANHHPDLDVRYSKVRVVLSTHSEGGITEKDLSLAGEIDVAAAGRSKG
jgi:4a-hydroxytetrahydrobiopterin dehydratase